MFREPTKGCHPIVVAANHTCVCVCVYSISCRVATMSRLLKIDLFCKRALQKRDLYCKRDLYFSGGYKSLQPHSMSKKKLHTSLGLLCTRALQKRHIFCKRHMFQHVKDSAGTDTDIHIDPSDEYQEIDKQTDTYMHRQELSFMTPAAVHTCAPAHTHAHAHTRTYTHMHFLINKNQNVSRMWSEVRDIARNICIS